MALSIVQQLVLSPGGDDDMGTLLGKFVRWRANCPNPPYHNGLHVYIFRCLYQVSLASKGKCETNNLKLHGDRVITYSLTLSTFSLHIVVLLSLVESVLHPVFPNPSP